MRRNRAQFAPGAPVQCCVGIRNGVQGGGNEGHRSPLGRGAVLDEARVGPGRAEAVVGEARVELAGAEEGRSSDVGVHERVVIDHELPAHGAYGGVAGAARRAALRIWSDQPSPTNGTPSNSAALRFISAGRRSYLAVVPTCACPASRCAAARSAPASSRSPMKVRRRSCGENGCASPKLDPAQPSGT